MEVLVYYGKHGTSIFKCSDRLEALWRLFKILDGYGCYEGISGDEKTFYIDAKTRGDKKAAATLLQVRKGHEYEGWSIEPVE
jgi:hypothetical protein